MIFEPQDAVRNGSEHAFSPRNKRYCKTLFAVTEAVTTVPTYLTT